MYSSDLMKPHRSTKRTLTSVSLDIVFCICGNGNEQNNYNQTMQITNKVNSTQSMIYNYNLSTPKRKRKSPLHKLFNKTAVPQTVFPLDAMQSPFCRNNFIIKHSKASIHP